MKLTEFIEIDHDQMHKELIEVHLQRLFDGFLPEYTKHIDASHPEWQPNDVFPDPPDGIRREIDMLAKVKLKKPANDEHRDQDMLALLHIEIESDYSMSGFGKRMHRYWMGLQIKYDMPVLPIALFLKVGDKGIGVQERVEFFHELDVCKFKYLFIGLSALNAEDYLKSDNPLAIAYSALMKQKKGQKVECTLEAMRKLASAKLSDQERFMLLQCVETYSDLNENERTSERKTTRSFRRQKPWR
jgi:hypothetical protein